jgi:hypothetical protein
VLKEEKLERVEVERKLEEALSMNENIDEYEIQRRIKEDAKELLYPLIKDAAGFE